MSGCAPHYRLDGAATTLLFDCTQGVPHLIYLGASLPLKTNVRDLIAALKKPTARASLDVTPGTSLHPEPNAGHVAHPALLAYRPMAPEASWDGRFALTSVETSDDNSTLRFICADLSREVELTISVTLASHSDVAVLKASVRNTSTTQLLVEWLSAPVLSVPQALSEQLLFHGRWCQEFALDRCPIPLGVSARENRRGRTSHESFPGIVLLEPSTDQEHGACLAAHLGWSGNHRVLLERDGNGETLLQMGILYLPGEATVASGDSLHTPEIYVCACAEGLNAMSARLHAFARKELINFPKPQKARPVTVNTWEAVYFDHDLPTLFSLVERAAHIGAERFVLDDGWFGERDDDTSSLGDWYVDSRKYPDGLTPLVDRVSAAGMEFGLWVEPEMVNPDSALYRDHPDWVLGIAGHPTLTGRNQLVLDIARADVTDYLFNRLAALLTQYDIAYLKWDMNRNFVSPGDQHNLPAASRQTTALYRLLDRLRGGFPHVEIESCASGGARIDYEILKRTHRFWVSDSNDAVERMRIQSGYSYFFPPEVMGAHVGPAWCHSSGRGLNAGLRALVAGFGHLGFELDLNALDDAQVSIFKATVERYKRDRDIWHHGAFYRIATVDPNLLGVCAVDSRAHRACLVMAQLDRARSTVPPLVRVPGLCATTMYNVSIEDADPELWRATTHYPNPLGEDGLVLCGQVLMCVGLQLPVLEAQRAIALRINAIDEAVSAL